MATIYRIVVEFETREEAEACLEVLAIWEMPDMFVHIDPPENPFAVHSIEEVEVED